MHFIVAFAAILAVASAAPQYLTHDFGAVVEGPKTIIAGPSGTITADTGSIVKSATGFVAPVATRLIGAPLIDTHILGARSYIGAPLLHRALPTTGFIGSRSLYGDYLF